MKQIFSAETALRPVSEDIDTFHGHLGLMNREFNLLAADINDPEWVKAKLRHMAEIDQHCLPDLPGNWSEDRRTEFRVGIYESWTRIISDNIAALKLIIAHHGWPDIGRFGKQADQDAWLIVQHADCDFTFQESCLEKLEKIHRQGGTEAANYAYLYDRVQTNEDSPHGRRPQRYGTQGDLVNGIWQPFPVEDIQHVDTRRAECKIIPPRLADYTDMMNLRTNAEKDALLARLKLIP